MKRDSNTIDMEFSREYKDNDYEPFKYHGHVCALKKEILDPLLLAFPDDMKHGKLKRTLARFYTVNDYDITARKKFRSQYAIDREKVKHLLYFPHMIHPSSKLRGWWETIMIFILMSTLIFSPADLALWPTFHTRNVFYHNLKAITELFCFFDILLRFCTGINSRQEPEACMDLKKVAIHYLKRSFIFEFLAVLPCDDMYMTITNQSIVYLDIFPTFKLIRALILMQYLDNVGERNGTQLLVMRSIKLILVYFIYFLWVAALQFTVVYIYEGAYQPSKPHPRSWLTVFEVWDKPTSTRAIKGLYRATLLITFQGLGQEFPRLFVDQLFAIFVWMSSLILSTIALSIIVATLQGVSSLSGKYYTAVNQLKLYMERNELPQNLRDKLLLYYELRYTHSFFAESTILEIISGRLLQDVTMHSCRKVVKNVPFLKHLPDDVLIKIVTALSSEIFLPDEVIVSVDRVGDCMYFIVSGTVAVYSASGHELCHLQDGAHFGEVSILGGLRKRMASVIALSPCELLRLNAVDFARAAARHPELLEELVRIAFDRVEKANEVDKTTI